MTKDTRLIWGYYLVAFILTILSGLVFGFNDSHTAPMPFLLGLFFIFFGIVWITTDLIILILKRTGTIKGFIAHVCGLIINGLFFYYLIAIALGDSFI